jgi:molybdate transport system ATP-binding protein
MTAPESASLLEVRLEREGFRVDLRIEWDIESLVLFGPRGAGKTTLLRVMLGLEPAARAKLRLAGVWLENPDTGLRQPVHRRRLGWVPQSPTLFPDRSVMANIRFGASARADDAWMQRTLDVLELESVLSRSVNDLSGGERQRVALARALAIHPRALLLDEPMASLDVGLRARVLPYLLRIREELDLPLVYITHDPDEAILLGDEIAVLDGGRRIAQGPPRETLWSQAVHSLAGGLEVENVLEVTCSSGSGHPKRVRTRGGLELETPWPAREGERWTIGIRGEDILISLDRPNRISARNVIPGRVAAIDDQPDHRQVHVDADSERLIAKLGAEAVDELGLSEGTSVFLIVKSQALRRIR